MPLAGASGYTRGVDAARKILFEDPLPLWLLLVVVEAVIVAVWLARRAPRWKLAMGIPLLLGGASALTAHLVVTDREYIAAALREMAAGAEAGDFEPVERHLHKDCRMPRVGRPDLDRQALLGRCKGAQRRYKVDRVKPTGIVTLDDGDAAVTNLWTTVGLASGEQFRLRWRFKWARTDEGMRVIEVELVEPGEIAERVF